MGVNIGSKFITIVLCVLAVVIITGYPIKKYMCAYPECFEKPVKGSSYCEEHKCKNCALSRNSGYGDLCYDCFKNTKSSHKTGLSFYGTAEVEYLKKETHHNKNKTNNIPHTTNKKYHDPIDYDTPEEFADDAYGSDFDDWDDAYEYWDNY